MTSRNIGSSILKVFIVSDTKGFKKGMDEADRATVSTADKLKLLGKAAAAYLAFQAVRAVKAFVKDSKRAFIDLNESINAVNVVYGKHADRIVAMARGAATAVGMSASEFNSFAVKFAGFAEKIAGPGGDVVGVVGDISKRVADFASVMNIDVATATDKFMSGLAGQSRPLREYSIDLSDTAVKLHAVAAGLHSGTGEMTEAEKVQARYSLLMKETEKTAGDFANTSGELANATRIASKQMENAKAAFGEAIHGVFKLGAPVMGHVAGAVTDLSEAFSVLTDEITIAERAKREFDRTNERGLWGLERLSGIIEEAFTVDKGIASLHALTGGVSSFIQTLSGGRDEVLFYAEAIDELTNEHLRELLAMSDRQVESMFSGADAALLREAAQNKLNHSMALGVGPILNQTDAFEDFEEAQEEARIEAEKLTLALERQSDRLRRQTDPLFNLISSWDDYETAQQDVLDAEREFGAGSAQHLAAIASRGRAFLDVKGALESLAASPVTHEMWVNMAASMGIPKKEADLIWARIIEIRKLNGTVVNIRVNENIVTSRSGTGGAGTGGFQQFQHGGRPKKGEPAIVGEAGPELFVPDTAGRIIPNGKNKGTPAELNGHGPTVVIHNVTVQGSVTTERELAQALAAEVRDELLRMQRRGSN